MTPGAPRTGAGIESQARELVEDLARRSGLSPSDLLRRLIADEDPEDVSSQDFFNDAEKSPYIETARPGSDAPPRMEALGHPVDELHRVTGALNRLTDRIESAESRSTVVIGGLQQSVHKAILRLDDLERDQIAVASRFEGALHELTTEQARFSERVRRIEQEAVGPRSAEAVRGLENTLGKVAGHLYEGESRTQAAIGALRQRLDQIEADRPADPASLMDDVVSRISQRLEAAEARTTGALRDLQGAFAALDDRMRSVEGLAGPGVDEKLAAMAATLAAQVEDARSEMIERIRATGDAAVRDDRFERALGEVSAQVLAVERRAHEAVEKIGRDVIAVAETLGHKVQAVENRHADSVEQLGGEVARIALGMETKLNRADAVQAQALEKLGNEIARITERLSERVANAERRAAQAIDDVGEQVSRVSERLSARTDRTSTEIADRIRQSEERTARMLDEARERIDMRLAEAQRLADGQGGRLPEPAHGGLVPGFPAASQPSSDTDYSPFSSDPFATFEQPPLAAPFETPAPIVPPPAPRVAPPPMPAAAVAAPVLRAPEPEPATDDFDDDALDDDLDPFAAAPASERLTDPFAPAAPPAADFPTEPEPEPRSFEPPAFRPSAFDADAIEPAPEPEDVFEPDDEPDIAQPGRAPHFSQVDFDAADALAARDFADDETAEDTPPAGRTGVGRAIGDGLFGGAAGPLGGGVRLNLDEDTAAEPVAEEMTSVDPPALSTREIIERARASARAAAQPAVARPARPSLAVDPEPAPTSSGMFSALNAGRKSRKASSNLPNAVLVTGLVAAFGGAVGGYMWLNRPTEPETPRYAAALNAWRNGGAAPASGDRASTPRVAVALSPTPLAGAPGSAPARAPTAAGVAATPAGSPAAAAASGPTAGADLYAAALAGIRTGDRSAVAALRRAADLGYAPAQFYLATLYSEGRSGVPRDRALAQMWTERAARGGDRWAMHNLALNYYEGVGGHPDPAAAAQWFRRAADLGLVDSQYNMGRLYETGVGVTQNPAEAYKWYLIAARSGDADSRASANRVRATLSAQARSASERAATAYRPTPVAPLAAPPASVAGALDPASVTTAQRALSRLRYLQGPADGVVTPALAAAVTAFQRDHNLPQTGLLDPATLAQLTPNAN